MPYALANNALGVETERLFKRLRKRSGMSQKDAAQRLGISQGQISKRENGDVDVPVEDLYEVGEMLGLSRDVVDDEIASFQRLRRAIPPVVGNVSAGAAGLLTPLTAEQRRELPLDAPVFLPVPDATMSGKLERGDLALVKALPPERIPRAAHGKVCYVVFTPASDQGEPEFGLVLEHDADNIIIAKTEPGRGPATRVVPLSDIYNVGVVVGVYKAI